ncbi:PE family protein [Mycobacterium kyorinense]|uniref:PE family protein n=1 Tax=Mycobacterium kyorinense TaxID=487514 RepID=A0A1X1Y9Q2_9MYCO|nr:PE family protein [Mycobacterium kyorinense]ORW07744.1 PE family protein [Mycobacterium kyorinense]
MSFVSTQPEALTAAAADVRTIGSALNASNATAAVTTTGVIPAAADEVSALTAAQFSAHAQWYQTIRASIHELFAITLRTSGSSYAATEAANTLTAG